MKRNSFVRTLTAIVLIFSFGFTCSAETAGYAVSALSGGLPSASLTRIDSADDITLLSSETDDDSDGSNAILTAGLIIGGIAVTALIIYGIYRVTSNAADNCSDACGDGCGSMFDECGDNMSQSCADSMAESCKEEKIASVFSSGAKLIPVYVR